MLVQDTSPEIKEQWQQQQMSHSQHTLLQNTLELITIRCPHRRPNLALNMQLFPPPGKGKETEARRISKTPIRHKNAARTQVKCAEALNFELLNMDQAATVCLVERFTRSCPGTAVCDHACMLGNDGDCFGGNMTAMAGALV
ncbi:hypothetical protein BaRGS_00025414 [Batillaria attramentaria]|uniref:Uncharacterized protein n=1 Tax=Batillaria attramentaria TaxID=370345 RepID=A0ABD0K8D7_9CAEN